jgi:hypothetical protein
VARDRATRRVARELEARRAAHGVSKEGGSRGIARGIVTELLPRHRGGAAALTAIDRRSGATRRLGEQWDRTTQRHA